MNAESHPRTAQIIYRTEVNDYASWQSLMKEFSPNWQKTKSTDEAPIWHPIEGRGYVIWVSMPHLHYLNDERCWRVIVSAGQSMSDEGTQVMDRLVEILSETMPDTIVFDQTEDSAQNETRTRDR